jgi:isopenicillin N synthase-like dioxygenase
VIPVVDLGRFVDGDADERVAVGAEIDDACRTAGFFTVVGHGVDPAIVADLHRSALAFFDLPLEDRLAVRMPEPGYPYGYSPYEGEALTRSLGTVGAVADLKETFNVGPIDPPPRPLTEMDDVDERAVYAPNLWPPALPELRPAVERWYRAMAQLSATIMEAFAVALGLGPDSFDGYIDRHGSALRLAHYPAPSARPAAGEGLRAGAHTDYGTLTVLWTDGAPGLQVEALHGGWVDVEPVEGGLIVNLGDLMQRWTNDRWRSTMHRVVPVGSGRRLSIPFFHNANWDAPIECIVTDGAEPRYPPTTAGRHLMEKFRSTVT